MTVLQLHGPMAFRVLQWCHPMPASIKEDKLLFPDDHLIWCPKVDSGPRRHDRIQNPVPMQLDFMMTGVV